MPAHEYGVRGERLSYECIQRSLFHLFDLFSIINKFDVDLVRFFYFVLQKKNLYILFHRIFDHVYSFFCWWNINHLSKYGRLPVPNAMEWTRFQFKFDYRTLFRHWEFRQRIVRTWYFMCNSIDFIKTIWYLLEYILFDPLANFVHSVVVFFLFSLNSPNPWS